jgi:hypothetical protein
MGEPATGLGLGRDDYWRFLRRVYGMQALEAWNYIKRVGTPPSAADIRAAIGRKA